jgi:hypothetical protein
MMVRSQKTRASVLLPGWLILANHVKTVAAMGPRIRRSLIGDALPNKSGARQARRNHPAVAPVAAMSPCRYGRHTSSTEPAR